MENKTKIFDLLTLIIFELLNKMQLHFILCCVYDTNLVQKFKSALILITFCTLGYSNSFWTE